MIELTDADRSFIKAARAAGALCDLDGEKIHAPNGTILLACADGDQFFELLHHHCHIAKTVRHHALLLNGGPLLVAPASPIENAGTDGEVLLRHIDAAVPMKGIPTVVLCTHAPCGAARKANLDFLDVLRLLMEAKLRLRKSLDLKSVERIHCFCHVDHGGNHKRTYCVLRIPACAFLEALGRPVRMF